MSDTNAEVLERLQAKDAMLFGLSDTLDVKSSIALVVITFLATQSGVFLASDQLPVGLSYIQLLSAFVLAAAGVVSLVALWPRDYETETAEELDVWEQQLRAHYQGNFDAEESVATAFRSGRIQRLKERIAANAEVDRVKSNLVAWSFRLSGIGLLLNMATLVGWALR
jgi:hypothetical protein